MPRPSRGEPRSAPRERPAGGAPPQAAGLVVQRSPEQRKVDALEKAHGRLMRDVRRARAAVAEAESVVREAMTALDGRGARLEEQLPPLLGELRALFGALLGEQSPLGRRDQARVRRVLAELRTSLPPDQAARLRLEGDDDDDPGSDPRGAAGPRHAPPRGGRPRAEGRSAHGRQRRAPAAAPTSHRRARGGRERAPLPAGSRRRRHPAS